MFTYIYSCVTAVLKPAQAIHVSIISMLYKFDNVEKFNVIKESIFDLVKIDFTAANRYLEIKTHRAKLLLEKQRATWNQTDDLRCRF